MAVKNILNASKNILDRRMFLKATAGAALAAGSLYKTSLRAEPLTEGRKIRVGVIGCGSVSWKYIPDKEPLSLAGD
jgi:hypothetical protein